MSALIRGIVSLLFSGILLITGCAGNREERGIKVIAHRGVHSLFPENALSSIGEAIRIGCDFVEVDVRTTEDSFLVLMHNRTVESTMNGSGRVSEMNLEEIKALFFKPVQDTLREPERIPTFEEALGAMRGRISAYVDVKDADPEKVLDALKISGMMDRAVIYSDEQELARFKALEPECRIMPEVDSFEDLDRVVTGLAPDVVAMSWHGFSEPLVNEIHARGLKVFLDVLGEGDNEEGVRRVIKAGVDGIQTDHPEKVIRILEEYR